MIVLLRSMLGKGFGEPDNNEEYTIIQYNDSIYFDVGNSGGPYIQPSYTINNNTWRCRINWTRSCDSWI